MNQQRHEELRPSAVQLVRQKMLQIAGLIGILDYERDVTGGCAAFGVQYQPSPQRLYEIGRALQELDQLLMRLSAGLIHQSTLGREFKLCCCAVYNTPALLKNPTALAEELRECHKLETDVYYRDFEAVRIELRSVEALCSTLRLELVQPKAPPRKALRLACLEQLCLLLGETYQRKLPKPQRRGGQPQIRSEFRRFRN